MRRRDLLKYSLYATLATSGLTRFGLRPAAEQMAGAGIAYGRTLIHVMLLGGADLRYLFVPDPASAREYAAAFCNARKSIYQYNGANAAIYPDYGAVWRALYRSVTDLLTGVSFGIHNNEKVRFEANIADIFGAGKGLATLTDELELQGTGAYDDIVYLFNTDFGRQLRANGTWGTDHGRGNYSILLGRGVNGGTYGEMFPASEIQGAAGDTRFDRQRTDIQGLTSFERVLAETCDWVEPDTGDAVFPGAATSMSEIGGALGLFA